MRLGSRKSKIISELLNSENCITGQYLASILGVTSRTIRGDVADINVELEEEGIQILSSIGKGYSIDKNDRDKLSKLVTNQKDYIVPILPDARIDYIIKQLMLYPNGISLDAISMQIYVSKSTLDRDLIKVRQRLSDYNINLTKCSGDIISIDGDEQLVRELYNSFFLKAVKSHSIDKNILNGEISDIFDKARQIVHSVSEAGSIDLTGDEFDAAAVFIAVTFFRNIHGHTLEEYSKSCLNNDSAINNIINRIQNEINLNESEKLYIEKQLGKLIFGNADIDESDDIRSIIQAGVDKVKETFNYSFDERLNDNIFELLTDSYTTASELSLKDIKKEYPLAVEMAVSLVNFINHKSAIKICDEILAKVVLIFAGEMEKDLLSKELKKRDVVIVCQSGDPIKNLIETRIKRHFPGFNIIGFFPLYKIEKAIEMKPEMIISTVMAEVENIPVIVINPLFKDYDVLKISTVIRQIEHRENVGYNFLNLFREELFIKDIDAGDRYDAIKILSDILMDNGYAQEYFYQAVVERENISSTAISNMVAVPHAMGEGLGENIVAIGILKKPIDWDGEKVQLVFVINIRNASDGNVKQIFKSFYDLISSSSKVDRIIKSKNYYEFLKTINQ